MRNRAVRKLLQDEPTFLIGSPMCTAFSQMNHINHAKMDPMEVDARLAYGRKHLEFCTKLYDSQWKAGRYFLHEHPAEAVSWNEPRVRRFLHKHGVMRVDGDVCQYGLRTANGGQTGPARKSTGFMTNAPRIAKQLCRRCPNRLGWQVHNHIRLESGRTKVAQVYPPELCKAICYGFQRHLNADRPGQYLLANVESTTNTTSKEFKMEVKELEKRYKIVEENLDEQLEEAWDDVSGARLSPIAVKKARMEEIEYIHKMNLYQKIPISECHQRTKKGSIPVRWIDINKGDTDRPN